jgi:CheY-like chemotaxis protein
VTLLIVDDDLGFRFWLAKSLEPFGHSVIPADTVSQARHLLRQVKLSLDQLIINPSVKGAAEFAASLRRRHSQLKIVALITQEEKELPFADLHPDARRAKPDQNALETPAAESAAGLEWAKFVQDLGGQKTAGGRAN